jgi:hypothetical protein
MILGKLGEAVKEEFSVLDVSNNLVSGIPLSEFTAHLFNPNDTDVYDSTSVTFIELGHGHYRISFTPNEVGNWMLIVYHPTHFPWGKSNTIQVFANDFDSIAVMLQRVLGLVQENFAVDQNVYDENNNLTSSRVRIYTNNTSVGTDSNVLDTYLMTATYTGLQMTSYKMEKQ